MKTKLFFFLVILLSGISKFTSAQTNVSGGIYVNTTWTKLNSPYIVTGDIVLFPGKVLTLEPGVEVRFTSYYNIEVRGELIAIGTMVDSITFTSDTSFTKGAWKGINILNASQAATGSFKYCKMSYSDYGIQMECCFGSFISPTSYIKNSWFDNNTNASSGNAGWFLPIDSCLFTNNTHAITNIKKKIENCTFTNNDIAIYSSRFSAVNCSFQYNNIAIKSENISDAEMDSVDNCILIHNDTAIQMINGYIFNSTIDSNIVGILSTHSSSTFNGYSYYVPIKNNHICDNTLYNIQNENAENKNITGNCFCLTDSASIESKLFDGYDDITKGLFNYDIYDSVCQIVTESVYKIGINPSSVNNLHSETFSILSFPNPFNDVITVRFDNPTHKLYRLTIINSLGQKIQQVETSSQEKTIDAKQLGRGIYLLQIQQSGSIVGYHKLIK